MEWEVCMSDVKARRKALGLSRGKLAELAHVDKRILQLIEIAEFSDEESVSRLERVLEALEAGEPVPDLEAEVAALVHEHQAETLEIRAPTPGGDGSGGDESGGDESGGNGSNGR
jgi:transcriptional regulator with XRE-family HTH domain